MRNPTVLFLFILFLLCLALLVAIGTSPSPANAVGIPHPDISPMRAGGDGAARLSEIGIYGFLFQTLVLCSISALFVLGIPKQRRDSTLYVVSAIILACSIFVWYKIYNGHLLYLASNTTEYFFAFPTATAWMLYGVGFYGVLLIVFYCIGFKKYIYSDGDAKAFADLIREQQR